MKKTILSLANLKAAHAAFFGKAEQKEGKKSEEASDDKGTGEKSEDSTGEEDESEKKADVDTADGEKADDTEKKEEKKADEKKADTQPKGVFLSNEDFQMLTELASESVSLREESKGLKAKADLWDSYQAALHGVKPGADTAGAKGQEEKGESKDPHAELKAKYPKLTEGL